MKYLRTFLLPAAALALTTILAGCLGSAPPVPRDHYYRIVVSAPAAAKRNLLPGVLVVEPLQADGLLRERPLLYSLSGKPHEVQQHDYHYWSEAPPRMLQDQMVAYLRRSAIADSVVTPEMRVNADYRLSGKAKRLERLIGGGPPRVFVELELALVRVSDGSLLAIDSYSEEIAATNGDVKAAVVALNQATARIFERFLTGTVHVAAINARKRQVRRDD